MIYTGLQLEGLLERYLSYKVMLNRRRFCVTPVQGRKKKDFGAVKVPPNGLGIWLRLYIRPGPKAKPRRATCSGRLQTREKHVARSEGDQSRWIERSYDDRSRSRALC